MAKKAVTANRSKEIRDYAEANPNAAPKDIVAALGEKGIKISAQYVSTILSNARRKVRLGIVPGRRGRRPISGGMVGAEALLQAKKLVDAMGGYDQARSAINILAQLSS